MTLLFTIFVVLGGQPQPAAMDYFDLGQVTPEECRFQGHATATTLMGVHPRCQRNQCYALLRCKGGSGPEFDPPTPGPAGTPT